MRWNPTGDDSRQTIEEYNAETITGRNAVASKQHIRLESKLQRHYLESHEVKHGVVGVIYYLEKFKGLRSESRYYHTRG